ncbi:hypothetical protein C8R42DRAFT_640783 [Lentinula raphanica]|nr:hypothetical protein C8R42DRAFT_640783 [Lentinula raphanica]
MSGYMRSCSNLVFVVLAGSSVSTYEATVENNGVYNRSAAVPQRPLKSGDVGVNILSAVVSINLHRRIYQPAEVAWTTLTSLLISVMRLFTAAPPIRIHGARVLDLVLISVPHKLNNAGGLQAEVQLRVLSHQGHDRRQTWGVEHDGIRWRGRADSRTCLDKSRMVIYKPPDSLQRMVSVRNPTYAVPLLEGAGTLDMIKTRFSGPERPNPHKYLGHLTGSSEDTRPRAPAFVRHVPAIPCKTRDRLQFLRPGLNVFFRLPPVICHRPHS